MQLKKELGKNIQKYRKLNKITQEKLAEIVGIEINSISSIETGEYFPSPENLLKISKALDISLSNLFYFKEIRNIKALCFLILPHFYYDFFNFYLNY